MAFTDRLHNRGSISTGYEIANSLKFESDNLETLYAVPWSSAGTRTTHTWSIWVKRTELGTRQMLLEGGTLNTVTGQLSLSFQTNDALEVRAGEFVPGSVAGTVYRLTNRVFRDTSAWYHIVAAFDTTQATANNRIKIWINGVQETSFATIANPAQNTDLGLFAANAQQTVGASGNNGFYYNGYITHAALVYNQQLDADSFGEFDPVSGIWKPIDLEDLTFGAFGFWLKFENPSSLGTDSSGNNYGFTPPNITSADQATDTPTNNFSTFNVLHPYSSASNHNPTFTEGATRFTTLLPGYWEAAVASMGITSGKWYFEAQPGTSTSHITSIGYGDESDIHDWGQNIADTNGFIGEGGTNSIGYLGSDTSSSYGNIWLGTGSTSNVNANYTISNIVGVAIDADNGYVYFARDNTYVNSGNPGSGASGTGGYTFQDVTTPRTGTVFPAVAGYYHTAATVININFGGYTTISISSAETDENGYGTFEYAPPSGYYALCTKNLAEYG